MSIDTDIRHVTKPGTNLFRELGFAPAEAECLHAQSQRQIKRAKAKQGLPKALVEQPKP